MIRYRMGELTEMKRLLELGLTEEEILYIVAVSLTVIQHVPSKSLPTYTGFTDDEIRKFIIKVEDFIQSNGIER